MLYFNNRFAKVQPYIYELISKKVSIDSSTVDRYIKKLVDKGILIPEQDKERHKKYYFQKLLDIIQ